MSNKNTLRIKNLHTITEDQNILKGINLTINSGEIHAMMGPNGSGKSTLSNTIMGHPKYKITKGQIFFNDTEITSFATNKRANLGLFLGFQHPTEIPGISMATFLRTAINSNAKAQNKNSKILGPMEFMEKLEKKSADLKFQKSFLDRSLNQGFSGGEKKRAEIIQMTMISPKIIILDEIDSGLDIDSLKIVARAIKKHIKNTGAGILLITHYNRLLKFITPDKVHVISNGKIVKSGDKKLAEELEKNGYEKYIK